MKPDEKLYYAAKAAGITYPKPVTENTTRVWSPYTDDGDAFRLAHALGLNIDFYHFETIAEARMDIVDRAAYVGMHK